jgi:hypothetical protein
LQLLQQESSLLVVEVEVIWVLELTIQTLELEQLLVTEVMVVLEEVAVGEVPRAEMAELVATDAF